jgi:polyferredoxin
VVRRLLYVAFFIEVGLLLIVLPWSSFWERNYFAAVIPAIQPLLTNNFIRGAVSGLGVLNLLAGFAELVPVFTPRDRHDMIL